MLQFFVTYIRVVYFVVVASYFCPTLFGADIGIHFLAFMMKLSLNCHDVPPYQCLVPCSSQVLCSFMTCMV
jgi:hypothetical protein